MFAIPGGRSRGDHPGIVALAGLRSTVTRTALGASPCSSAAWRLPQGMRNLMPAALRPGRAKLASNPRRGDRRSSSQHLQEIQELGLWIAGIGLMRSADLVRSDGTVREAVR